MHAEILRTQTALLHVLHGEQERLELLSRRQLDELRSEAELVQRTANGTLRGACEMVMSICKAKLEGE